MSATVVVASPRRSTLASDYHPGDGQVSVGEGKAALIADAPSGGSPAPFVLIGPDGTTSVFQCTGRSGNVLTGVVAIDGTRDTFFPRGSLVCAGVTGGGGAGGGGSILLEQHDAANSADLDFTSWYSSSYDAYLIEVVGLLPATNAASIRLRWSIDGGATYDGGANYVDSCFATALTGTNRSSHSTATSHPLHLYDFDAPLSNDAAHGGLCASLRIANPGGSAYKNAFGMAHYWASTSNWIDGIGGLVYQSASAANAFRIYGSSGNLASGTVRVYGLSK